MHDRSALLGARSWPDCFSCPNPEIENPYELYLKLSEPRFFPADNPDSNVAVLGIGGALAPSYTLDPLMEAITTQFGIAGKRICLPGNDGTLERLIRVDEQTAISEIADEAQRLRTRTGAEHLIVVGLSAGGKASLAAQEVHNLFSAQILVSVPLHMHGTQHLKLGLGLLVEKALSMSSKLDGIRESVERTPICVDYAGGDQAYLSPIERGRPYMKFVPGIHLVHIERLRRTVNRIVSYETPTIPCFAGFATEDWVVDVQHSMHKMQNYLARAPHLGSSVEAFEARHTIPHDPRSQTFIDKMNGFIARQYPQLAAWAEQQRMSAEDPLAPLRYPPRRTA